MEAASAPSLARCTQPSRAANSSPQIYTGRFERPATGSLSRSTESAVYVVRFANGVMTAEPSRFYLTAITATLVIIVGMVFVAARVIPLLVSALFQIVPAILI